MISSARVLLVIGAGIAAYKCLELIRRLREQGASVRTVLTPAAAQFVTPLSVSSLSGDKVYQDLFNLTDESEMGHIELSRSADLIVVAPATADLLAKMANGLANDLASTVLLATNKPVLIAPAMNVRMWTHAATQRNIAQLRADGIRVVGPNSGDMACGETGPGRMADPEEILAAIKSVLTNAAKLQGLKALVTAGPTLEPIDPVRFISNRSSGKQGYAIAEALQRLGAETTLVSGPTSIAPPQGVKVVNVETANEMLAACERLLPVDIGVFTAAVADWRSDQVANQKMKKTGAGGATLTLVRNPDILRTISTHGRRPRLVVGFAAETEKLIEHARLKLASKKCDWIVANDVSKERNVMGGDNNTVHLISTTHDEVWPTMSKVEVARRLAEFISDRLAVAS